MDGDALVVKGRQVHDTGTHLVRYVQSKPVIKY